MTPEPNNNESATVRLWTFQQAAIVPALRAPSGYRPTWPDTPENWRIAYEWMAKQLAEVTKRAVTGPPIWCWHSCNGQFGAPPTVGTAMFLLSSCQIEQGMVTIELAVPVEFVLLSSYHAWSRLLDFVIVEKRMPKSRWKIRRMFVEPLFKHDTDDIQAVIPSIESAWVRGVTELNVAGRQWDAPILPGS